MKLDEIFEEWEKDAKIDESELSHEQAQSPLLHHKYLKMLSLERRILKELRSSHDILYKNRSQWYMGKLSPEKMNELGWEPNNLKSWKDDLSTYMKADEIMIQSHLRIGLQEEKVSVLDSIISTINNRNWQIKNCIDWIKYINGVN